MTAYEMRISDWSSDVCSSDLDEHKFTALMHDAAEAYLGDIPKPLKNLLPDYSRIEKYLMNIIAAKFGFEYPVHPIIKEADMEAIRRAWQENVITTIERASRRNRECR